MADTNQRNLDSGVGVITVLIVTLWGAFGNAMKPYESMNAIKDVVMKATDPTQVPYLYNLVWNDWFTMDLGCLLFLALLAFLLWSLPAVFSARTDEEQHRIRKACRLASILPIFGALVNFISVFSELPLMLHKLNTL